MKSIVTKFNAGQEVFIGVCGFRKVWKGVVHMARVEMSPYGTTTTYDIIVDDKKVEDNYFKDINEDGIFTTYEDAKRNWLGDKTEGEFKKAQAESRLAEMSLEDCIKFYNEHATDHYRRYCEIHETEDDEWWTRLAEEYGAHYLVYDIEGSVKEKTFCPYDDYFFYNGDDCRLYSFTDKEEMMKIIGEWFIEELINRKEE